MSDEIRQFRAADGENSAEILIGMWEIEGPWGTETGGYSAHTYDVSWDFHPSLSDLLQLVEALREFERPDISAIDWATMGRDGTLAKKEMR